MRLDPGSLKKLGGFDRERLQGLARHLPTAFTLGLVIAIAYSVADIAWRVIPLDDAPVANGGPAPSVAEVPDTEDHTDLEQLLALSVFGEPDPEEDTTEEIDLAELNAPETQLNLELRGVLATEIPEMARAIIASGRDEDKSYKVGDSLGSGATLRAIYSNRVILERGGELETLRLPRENGEDGLVRAQASDRTARQDRGNGDEYTVPEDVAGLRDSIRENPERITDVIRPTPHREDGEMVGFRVFPGRMRDEFQQMGLRAGDIVTAVNGTPLDSAAAGMRLLNELEDASSVELTIRRGGRETSVTISLGQ
ncbi:type II secretion system protein GspC [Gammaproteobacteria bacterium AB-CW1]|uniref:Type II secretion system protein GspC n=1 Tax=Natronospira elongata TaxID=3110268 RepID=A0AAP6MMX1_9GAMM|nr:type II secretion system protein GspC [Gammaproteobacteria bacterium AB-CW1]